MKIIDVPFLDAAAKDLQTLDLLMAAEPLQAINISPWAEYDTTAQAGFSIAHLNDAVLVRYVVKEEVLKSLSRGFNENVHQDNCIELFIALDPATDHYYNIELNCLGSIKIGYGTGREGRIPLGPEQLKAVGVKTQMEYLPGTGIHSFKWQLLLHIPVSVFCFNDMDALQGCAGRANFYKCGDELPGPHFLAWNAIDTPSPDFHRPEFFGQLNFGNIKS